MHQHLCSWLLPFYAVSRRDDELAAKELLDVTLLETLKLITVFFQASLFPNYSYILTKHRIQNILQRGTRIELWDLYFSPWDKWSAAIELIKELYSDGPWVGARDCVIAWVLVILIALAAIISVTSGSNCTHLSRSLKTERVGHILKKGLFNSFKSKFVWNDLYFPQKIWALSNVPFSHTLGEKSKYPSVSFKASKNQKECVCFLWRSEKEERSHS